MFLFFSSLNGPSGSLNATLPSSSFSTWNVTLKLLICPLLVFLLSQNSQKSFPYLVTVSGHHPVSVFLFSCPCFKWLSWFLLCYMIFAFHSWLKLHSCSSQMIAWSVDCFWALLDISFWQLIILPGDSEVKNLFTMQETQVPSLGQEDPLEKEMGTHSRIPWAEWAGGLQSMGLQRVGHDLATNTHPSFLKLSFLVLRYCSTLFHLFYKLLFLSFHSWLFPAALQNKELCKPVLLASPFLINFPIYPYISNITFMWVIPKVTFSQHLFCELLTYIFKCQHDMATLVLPWHLKHMSKLTSSCRKSTFLTWLFG